MAGMGFPLLPQADRLIRLPSSFYMAISALLRSRRGHAIPRTLKWWTTGQPQVEQFSGDPTERCAQPARQCQKQQPQTRTAVKWKPMNKAPGRQPPSKRWSGTGGDAKTRAGAAAVSRPPSARGQQQQPILPLGDSYDQGRYYLAATADTVFIHPMGRVFLTRLRSLSALFQGCPGQAWGRVEQHVPGELTTSLPWDKVMAQRRHRPSWRSTAVLDIALPEGCDPGAARSNSPSRTT